MLTMKKKISEQPYPRLLDFPSSMSGYEREGLAAEARLAAERKLNKKTAKPAIEGKRQ